MSALLADFSPLLRRVVFVGKATFGAGLNFHVAGTLESLVVTAHVTR